jgi:hypothetical protein
VHEDEVAQGLDHGPLAVNTVMLRVLGHGPDALCRAHPVVTQLSPGLVQIAWVVRADQQPYRVTSV